MRSALVLVIAACAVVLGAVVTHDCGARAPEPPPQASEPGAGVSPPGTAPDGDDGQTPVAAVGESAPATGEIVWSSDWSHGTGRSDEVLRDRGAWNTYSSPGDLLEVIPRPDGSGFPTWIENVLSVEYVGSSNARMLVASERWEAPAVGEYQFHRAFFSNNLADSNGTQSALAHHPCQTHSALSDYAFLWHIGTTDTGRSPLFLQLPGVDGDAGDRVHRLRPDLQKFTVYLLEFRIHRENESTLRFAARVSDASGALLHDSADLWDDYGDRPRDASLASNDPAVSYSSAAQLRSWEVGNNGPANWTANEGVVLWGGLAVAHSEDPDGWIGASEL